MLIPFLEQTLQKGLAIDIHWVRIFLDNIFENIKFNYLKKQNYQTPE